MPDCRTELKMIPHSLPNTYLLYCTKNHYFLSVSMKPTTSTEYLSFIYRIQLSCNNHSNSHTSDGNNNDDVDNDDNDDNDNSKNG